MYPSIKHRVAVDLRTNKLFNKSARVRSPLFRFFKEKWLLKIKSSVEVKKIYKCHFFKFMICKTIFQFKCCKTMQIALSFVNCL